MKKIIYLCLLSLAVVACKNTGKETTKTTNAEDVESFAQGLADISLDIRQPGDVADLLFLAGTDFMPELVNDPMNYTKYLGDNVNAAANIGVYMADGLYQIAFDKKYDGYLSIAASKQLAIAIGIGDIMSEIVLDRYSDGEYPVDSILNSIKLGLKRSELLLTEKDQAQIFAAMLVGNYIEKLFILLTNVFDYPVDLPEEAKLLILRDIILISGDDLNLIPDVIAIVDKYKKQEDSFLLAELKEIQAIRENNKLSKTEIEKLKPEMIFENEALLEIYAKVKAVRSYIIAE